MSFFSGGSKGWVTLVPPITAQNFLNFMQVLGNFWQNHRLAPPMRRILDLHLFLYHHYNGGKFTIRFDAA